MKNLLIVSCLILASGFALQAQSQAIPGQLVVAVSPEITLKAVLERHSPASRNSGATLEAPEALWTGLGLHSVQCTPGKEAEAMAYLNSLPEVLWVNQDFRAEERDTEPNDPEFGTQWNLAKVSADKAWDFAKGGVTADGDSIVIAIVEGFDPTVTDLVPNVWINRGEIPDNGKDDDGNGYIDDYKGYQEIPCTRPDIKCPHGTSVASIASARTDNGQQVAGLAWNAKIMVVSQDLQFTNIVKALKYVYDQRRIYNQTDGKKGAFVVAANCSFGVQRARPGDLPIYQAWCSMYDSLGRVGVIGAASTSNDVEDVGEVGDMPSLCSSDYMIAVTNTDQLDQLGGGYNTEHVDLAAPGDKIPTVAPGNVITLFDGTSAAAPNVSGALALLYSAPCPSLGDRARQEPSTIATRMKEAILAGVDKIGSLRTRVGSGGRLNVYKAYQKLEASLGVAIGPIAFLEIKPNPVNDELRAYLQVPFSDTYEVLVYNSLGQLISTKDYVCECQGPEIILKVPGLAPGVYYLEARLGKIRTTGRFLKY